MHKAVEDVLSSGAIGVELMLSGKLPGARAKSWRVAGGYLRKCGDAAVTFVNTCILSAQLKPGIIGIQVRIMPSGIVMPDEIKLRDDEPVATATSSEVAKTAAADSAVVVESAEGVVIQAADAEAVVVPKAEDEKAAKKAKSPRKKAAAKKSDDVEAEAAGNAAETVKSEQKPEAEDENS